MGFDVQQDGQVTVDHTHNKFGDTSVANNPTSDQTKCKLKVHSIFKRRGHNGKNKRDSLGDNCPMIYALKGLDGLHTDFSNIRRLNQSMAPILDKFVALPSVGSYELIIPMPSSSPIGLMLAKRVKRRMADAQLCQILSKITVAQAREQLNGRSIPHNDRSKLLSRIERQLKENGAGAPFSMKTIPTAQRQFLTPVNMQTEHEVSPSRILLVDDLFSTGTTLKTARNLLQERFPKTHIDALCLFSAVNGRIKN